MVTLSDIRRLTPATDNVAYFQTGGFSPKPTPVIEEVIKWLHFQNQGPALSWVANKVKDVFETTRTKVAQAINAHPDEIMLNENTTVGINVVANGIDWQPGDNVILSSHEHPGNRVPWYNFVDRYDIALRYVNVSNDPEELLDQFEQLMDGRTRLVAVSHVSRRTGVRFPAKAIVDLAHRRGVPVLLDGAQSFGAIPLDMRELDCDFYTFSGHKYIMAPQGTGGFYVRRDRIEWLKPSWIGSHSEKTMDDYGGMTLHPEAKRFEFGTRNLADQAGFGKALDLWTEIGWPNVFAAIAAYTDAMKAALLAVPGVEVETPLPYEQSAGIVTFRVPGFQAGPLSASLYEHERVLVAPAASTPESIRVSTHVFNTAEECDRLVAGIQRVQRSGF